MLVTKQKVFRKFWYPVGSLDLISDKPFTFTLLGEDIVVWQDSNGQLAAIKNRCCHRSAKLSKGTIVNGCIACPYHGWQYDRFGQVVFIPQLPNKKEFNDYKIPAYDIKSAYGYAWVCLDKPISDIPHIPEAFLPSFRLIPEFYETWHCAGLRVMENELDLAHPAFVHTNTFGYQQALLPEEFKIETFSQGLHLYATLRVLNPIEQQKNLKLYASHTKRNLKMTWHMPFTCILDIQYDNGLRHIIVNTMTPINDHDSQMVQFCLRNDSDNDVLPQDVIAFDRLVTLEDKSILESTDPDVPLNHFLEKHLYTDKPGILMRKQILKLLDQHGETEATNQ